MKNEDPGMGWKPESLEFTHAELIGLMIRARGIREGRWTVSVAFGIGAMAINDGQGNIYPSAIVPVKGLGLKPVPVEEPDGPNVVNAREVNSGLILPRDISLAAKHPAGRQ